MSSQNNLNPDVRVFYYGKKILESVEILPMSLADESKLINKFMTLLQSMQTTITEDTAKTVAIFFSFFKDNLNSFLEITTELDKAGIENVFNNITNKQLVALAEIVYKDNFEDALKNEGSLSLMLKDWLKKRLSPTFYSTIDNMTSVTSTEEVTETAD